MLIDFLVSFSSSDFPTYFLHLSFLIYGICYTFCILIMQIFFLVRILSFNLFKVCVCVCVCVNFGIDCLKFEFVDLLIFSQSYESFPFFVGEILP